MKNQKGISFIEINVSIVLFLIVAVCIIGMLANCTLWVRKTTELRQCIHLAQWKMAETQYMSETDIREGSDKFPAPFNNYTWRIQKLTPADPRLEGFTEIKVTAIGLTGTKHSLVILKSRDSSPRGSCLIIGWTGVLVTYASLFRKIPGKDYEQLTPWVRTRAEEINQAIWSRDGKYIFIHKNGDDGKYHLYKIKAKDIKFGDESNWDELDTGVRTWFQTSPTRDEIVYVKRTDEESKVIYECIVRNYKTGEPTTIYSKEIPTSSMWSIDYGKEYKVCLTSVCNPVFSPDGNKIALCFQDYDEPSSKLKVQIGYYDTKETDISKRIKILDSYEGVRADKQDFYFCKPAWSPNGEKLSYAFFDVEKEVQSAHALRATSILYKVDIDNPGTSHVELHKETPDSAVFQGYGYGDTYPLMCHGNRSVWLDNDKVAYVYIGAIGSWWPGKAHIAVKTTGGQWISFGLLHPSGFHQFSYDINPYYNGQTLEFLDYYNGDIIFNSGYRGEFGVRKLKGTNIGTTDATEYISKPPDAHHTFLNSLVK